ncbi:hypothetical protein Chor_012839 [Crotalus horridus]
MEARGSAGGGRPVKGILKNRSGSGSGSGSGRGLAEPEALSQASPLPPAGGRLQAQPSCESRGEEYEKKTQKWDEMNILATYHPPGKDYGLMKIDEPSTPYHSLKEEDAGSDAEDSPVPTADILAKKLAAAAQGQGPKILARQEDSSEEEEEDDEGLRFLHAQSNTEAPVASDTSSAFFPGLSYFFSWWLHGSVAKPTGLAGLCMKKKRQFEMKRKMHYNEAQNIKLARQLIAKEMHGEAAEEEDCEEEEDDEDEMQDERKTSTESGDMAQRLACTLIFDKNSGDLKVFCLAVKMLLMWLVLVVTEEGFVAHLPKNTAWGSASEPDPSVSPLSLV